MKKIYNKKTIILITFCFLFFLIGSVLLFLYFSETLSEYTSMSPGITSLMYLPIYLWGGISSFVVFFICLILLLIEIKLKIYTKLLTTILIVVLIIFGAFNITNITKILHAYDEKTYFSTMDGMDNMLPPNEKISKFFPYYSSMEKGAEQTPYYAFSTYKLNNTIYRISQSECNDYENICAFTAEYFKTDKPYLFGKFSSEKSMHYFSDENGEMLNPSLIEHKKYNGFEYDLIEQSSEKMILVTSDKCFFLFHYQDTMQILNLSTQEFINTAFNQFEAIQDKENTGDGSLC